MRTLSKWRIGLVKNESKRWLLPGTFCSHQIQFYHSIASNYHTVLQFVIDQVLNLSYCQYLGHNWAKCFCHHLSIIRSQQLWYHCHIWSVTAERQKIHFCVCFFNFILTWLFHPCWKSWTGAPNFSQENEAVCKCWYCKYTGSVFF